MNERPLGHTPGHARHDRLVVARYTAGEAISAEAEEGRRLVEQCADCARLADDLRLLRTSVARLPTPARTRNFRLTQAQADSLRGSAFDRFLRRLAAPRLAMLRPVAGVALAMGLTVAVVGAGFQLPTAGSAAAPPGERDQFTAVQDTTAATPTLEPQPAAVATDPGKESEGTTDINGPGATSRTGSAGGPPESTQQPVEVIGGPTFAEEATPPKVAPAESTDTTRLLLIYGGVSLATLSFAVLLLAWFARRHLEDPLLR